MYRYSIRSTGLILFAALCLGLLSAAYTYAEHSGQADSSLLVSSLRVDKALDFCGEEIPVIRQEVKERFEKEMLLSLWDRPQVILWLKRSTRYMPFIEDALKKNNLPDDLKYIAVAESALRPHSGSSKGAMGFWQFLKGTGKKYGLVIDKNKDERRNIFKSTDAALKYLKALHKEFGSWTLAAAAYNMGEEGLMTEILEQGTDDYYDLYLPLETQRYLFRILCVKLIMTDPEKYGFYLSEEDWYPPFTFDKVKVNCPEEVPLRIIAQAGETQYKAIKDFNPEIRGYYLSKGEHTILVPDGASKGFKQRYKKYLKKYTAARKDRTYIVKKGDNLSSIADEYDVPLKNIVIWNHLDVNKPIHPGDRLIIHKVK